MDICLLRRFHDLFHGCRGLAVGDILPDGSAEEVYILLYNTDLISKTLQRQLPYILSVNADGSAGDIIEPGQQRADRRLAAS